jgi:hypothetical protein
MADQADSKLNQPYAIEADRGCYHLTASAVHCTEYTLKSVGHTPELESRPLAPAFLDLPLCRPSSLLTISLVPRL